MTGAGGPHSGQADEADAPAGAVTARRRRPAWLRYLRSALLVAGLALAVVAIIGYAHRLRADLQRLSPWLVLAAFAAVVAANLSTLQTWRHLLGAMGSHLPQRAARRIFFTSQIGKYLPGSVWPYVAQVEMARDHHVPPSRSGAAGILTIGVTLVTGIVVAGLTLPYVDSSMATALRVLLACTPVFLLVLHPKLLHRALTMIMRVARRRTPLPAIAGGELLRAALWSVVTWLGFGLQIFVLVGSLHSVGPSDAALAVGGYALAWVVGLLIVIVPAGAGAREAILVFTLDPTLNRSSALLIALVSRLLTTAADVLLAGAVGGERLWGRRRRGPDGHTRRGGTTDEEPPGESSSSIAPIQR